MKSAGVPITTHKIRHAFASKILKAGFTLYQTQKMLGHKDPKSTLVYSHLESQDVSAKVTELLNAQQVENRRKRLKIVTT